MKDEHLRVGQNGCEHGGGGINLTENAFSRPEITRYYSFYAPDDIQLHTPPSSAIRMKLNLLDQEVGLDQGKNGFVLIHKKDIENLCKILQEAKRILDLGS